MALFPSHPSRRPLRWRLISLLLAVVFAVLLCIGHPIQAQIFNSGSNGSDGALNLTTPGIIDFDPVALGLDQDGDGVYHFTTITIAAGVTVRLSARFLPGPVFWLASGPVQIDGFIDLNGQPGQDSGAISRAPSVPGAGGFVGGAGGTSTSPAQSGSGPGGGLVISPFLDVGGGGAGHAEIGRDGENAPNSGGPAYGNIFLVPLVGGSGGGGGIFRGVNGSGGGAGGGAILIASSTSITLNGAIHAQGGSGGVGALFAATGGGGSGGSIRLVAPTISKSGNLRAEGGLGGSATGFDTPGGGAGSPGRIRLEAFEQGLPTASPTPHLATPVAVFLPTTFSSLRVVSVAGVPVVNPMGSFTMPDVTINSASPVAVVIEARDIPLSAVVTLHLIFENAADLVVGVPPLTGTEALSQTTITTTEIYMNLSPEDMVREFQAKWFTSTVR